MLLKHVIEKADREGRKMHLEATPAGRPVYERLGFREIDVVEIDLRQWGGEKMGVNYIMVREPVVVKASSLD